MIYFASDHAGFELKNALLEFVQNELAYEVEDLGAFEFDETDDFNDFIGLAAKAVSVLPEESKAIILGGSGQGEAMMANRYRSVRATVYYGGPSEIIALSREHNDANILSLGARFLDYETASEAVRLWLATGFSNEERYIRRNQKLEEII